MHGSAAALSTERILTASPSRVFAAFARPDLLAQWWGPHGFTSTFEQFDFTPGGRWVFVLHGPDGTDYPNESVFRDIQPDRQVVLEHVVGHWFLLTVTLTARGDGTHLTWVQEFRSPEVAAALRSVVDPANEQNLDRLEAVLARHDA